MAKYKGRVPSENIDDIRTGRGSPDDRQEQKNKRNRYLDENYIKNLRNEVAARNAPPLPKPDPRTKMPGGELAIGENMSRDEFRQQNAEQALINSRVTPLAVFERAGKVKKGESFWGSLKDIWFNFDDRQKRTEVEMRDQEQFLLDTFKRARSVGYPIHPINEQPAQLPMKFKAVDQRQGIAGLDRTVLQNYVDGNYDRAGANSRLQGSGWEILRGNGTAIKVQHPDDGTYQYLPNGSSVGKFVKVK